MRLVGREAEDEPMAGSFVTRAHYGLVLHFTEA